MSSDAARELRPGDLVGPYRVVVLLGKGGMGQVYEAIGPEGDHVALKIVKPDIARDAVFRRRFEREASIAQRVVHSHVVPVIDVGEHWEIPYLVQRFITGGSLEQRLDQDGTLSLSGSIRIGLWVAAGLDAVHAAGLVHRDVKPGNILVTGLTPEEHAYVCDFGLARHVSSVSSLTGDRGFVGTIDYVPPEQIAGRPIDRRADVYSLGCVLYECLTGERPFERDSELALVFAHLNDPPPAVTDLRPELPEALDVVVATALAKEPGDRYTSCGELAAATQAALAGKPFGRRRTRRRRRSLVATVAVLAAGAAGSVGYVLTRAETPAAVLPAITQTSIAGVELGRTKAFYNQRFGGYKELVLTEWDPPIPGLSFGQPEVAVYFRENPRRADILTTWNRQHRTAAGIGPCSTIAEMKKAYGEAVQPSPHGTSPDGKTVHSYVVGRNLIFVTQDQRTISAVGLYRGTLPNTERSDRQGWANFVAAVETPCL